RRDHDQLRRTKQRRRMATELELHARRQLECANGLGLVVDHDLVAARRAEPRHRNASAGGPNDHYAHATISDCQPGFFFTGSRGAEEFFLGKASVPSRCASALLGLRLDAELPPLPRNCGFSKTSPAPRLLGSL